MVKPQEIAFASAMQKMIDNKFFRRKQEKCEYFSKNYSLNKIFNQWENLFLTIKIDNENIFRHKNLSSSVGGAERVLCEIASILVNRGHQITIITFDSIGSNSFYFLDPR